MKYLRGADIVDYIKNQHRFWDTIDVFHECNKKFLDITISAKKQ